MAPRSFPVGCFSVAVFFFYRRERSGRLEDESADETGRTYSINIYYVSEETIDTVAIHYTGKKTRSIRAFSKIILFINQNYTVFGDATKWYNSKMNFAI